MTQDKNSPELFYPGIKDRAKKLHPEIFKIIDEVNGIVEKKNEYESKSMAIPSELDVKLAEYVAYLESEELTVFNPAIAKLVDEFEQSKDSKDHEDFKNSIETLRLIVHEIAKAKKVAHESYPHVKKNSEDDLFENSFE